jgi:hypothetical protein
MMTPQNDEQSMFVNFQDYNPPNLEVNEFMMDDNFSLFNHLLATMS